MNSPTIMTTTTIYPTITATATATTIPRSSTSTRLTGSAYYTQPAVLAPLITIGICILLMFLVMVVEGLHYLGWIKERPYEMQRPGRRQGMESVRLTRRPSRRLNERAWVDGTEDVLPRYEERGGSSESVVRVPPPVYSSERGQRKFFGGV